MDSCSSPGLPPAEEVLAQEALPGKAAPGPQSHHRRLSSATEGAQLRQPGSLGLLTSPHWNLVSSHLSSQNQYPERNPSSSEQDTPLDTSRETRQGQEAGQTCRTPKSGHAREHMHASEGRDVVKTNIRSIGCRFCAPCEKEEVSCPEAERHCHSLRAFGSLVRILRMSITEAAASARQ